MFFLKVTHEKLGESWNPKAAVIGKPSSQFFLPPGIGHKNGWLTSEKHVWTQIIADKAAI